MSEITVAIAYHSGYGHTARQAEAVAAGAREVPGTTVQLLPVDEPTDALLAALDGADAIVFGAPTYMGAASAGFKRFAEATSKSWADGLRWKDKVAAGFTNSQNINGNKENTLLELAVLAAQHGMHWVSLGLYPGWNTTTGSSEDLNRLGSFTGAMAQSHGDVGPDVAPPATDLRTASALGRRVAEVTRDYVAVRRLHTETVLEGIAYASAGR
jgi:multimeric flavodoxin WrbA